MKTRKKWTYALLVPVLGFVLVAIFSIFNGSEFYTGGQVSLILGISTFYWIMLLFFPSLLERGD